MKPIIMTLLSFFLGAKADNAIANIGLVEAVRESIRAEVSAVIFKSLIGLVVAVSTIFSILQLGKALQVLFNQYKYGLFFEIGTFGLVSASGCVLLYLVFRTPPKVVIQTTTVEGVDLPGLFSRFTEGLVKGYQSNMASNTDPNRTLQADF